MAALSVTASPVVESRDLETPPGFNIDHSSSSTIDILMISPLNTVLTMNSDINGNGCPLTNSPHYDFNTSSVVLPGFNATAGPGVPLFLSSKSCQLSFVVNIPPGFKFRINTVGYRGRYQLDNKVIANQKFLYFFQGQIAEATARSSISGPVSGKDYSNFESFSIPLFSPCGASTVLNLASSIGIDNRANKQGGGYISIDSLKIGHGQMYAFDWAKC
ncbi:hypothetical protein FRC16_001898 [Serendipita sp. 398]|nr:hypothetical protein FRC16_001898 [Serendipita sp. 398]